VQHILTLSRVAVIVRHWFEADLGDASMEHGTRIELRELTAHPRRGSESAAQLIALDRPWWRADLFDRLADEPGTFGAAHYHPEFAGHEPCARVWDPELTARPWQWLENQFARLGDGQWELAPADRTELSALAAVIVTLARQFSPDRCRSATQCFGLTRDAREAVQLMIGSVRQPDLLDRSGPRPGGCLPRSGPTRRHDAITALLTGGALRAFCRWRTAA
jgi:hypothetical protein